MKKIVPLALFIFISVSVFPQTYPQVVKDVYPGSNNGIDNTNFVMALGNQVIFCGSDSLGTALWKSDGTAGGTVILKRLDIPASGNTTGLSWQIKFNNEIYFVAGLPDSIGYTNTLWKTDGTTAGTVPVTQLNPYGIAFDITWTAGPRFLKAGNYLYFLAYDTLGEVNGSLWRTDGTAQGTIKLVTWQPWLCSVVYAPLNNLLIFDIASKLYKTDGTINGTSFVASVDSTDPQAIMGNGIAAGNNLYFDANQSALTGWELWKTDGTPNGTSMVVDLNPTFGGDGFGSFVGVANNKVVFRGHNADTIPDYLWISDGTVNGTTLLANVVGAGGVGYVNNKLVFLANDGIHGNEPWVTDGTTGGTFMLDDVYPGSTGSVPVSGSFQAAGDGSVLYMGLVDSIHNLQVWKTNGTSAGTVFCFESNPGYNYPGFPEKMVVIDGRCYYAAGLADFGNGDELCITAGAPSSSLSYDLYPGAIGSWPENFVKAGTKIFFDGTDAVMGNELWSMDEPNISGIKETSPEAGFSIYPNPAASVITIDANGAWPVSISIYNINGQLAKEIKNPQYNTIDVSGFASGLYFVKLLGQNNETVHKFVKL